MNGEREEEREGGRRFGFDFKVVHSFLTLTGLKEERNQDKEVREGVNDAKLVSVEVMGREGDGNCERKTQS